MRRAATFSIVYPVYHPQAGKPTHFVEKIWKVFLEASSPLFPYWMTDDKVPGVTVRDCYEYGPKKHTIRKGKKWQKGDMLSPRIWSGKPYDSPQIIIGPDIEIKRVADIEIDANACVTIDGKVYGHLLMLGSLAKFDGLTPRDMKDWFNKLPFSGQILIWDEKGLPY